MAEGACRDCEGPSLVVIFLMVLLSVREAIRTLSRRVRSTNACTFGSHFVLEEGSERMGACFTHAGLSQKSSREMRGRF